MILSRSPLRISLGGGGSDLPSYYLEHEGFLISAAIDKYIFVSIMQRFTSEILVKYSKYESCDSPEQIEHPIIRESLKYLGSSWSGIEITSMADIPSGTGLGSSGSFTTALIKALTAYQNRAIQADEIARIACHVELGLLKEPIGKQDQYISAYGGITSFTFHRDETVTVKPLHIKPDGLMDLQDNLLLFFTGFSRSASEILKDQDAKSKSNDKLMLENLHYTKSLGFECKKLLENGEIESFGRLMHEHWIHKKQRSSGMSNPMIDEWYEIALKNGAVGGKLVGAGGGGFLMFYAKDRSRLRVAMSKLNLQEVRFNFDFEGAKIIY